MKLQKAVSLRTTTHTYVKWTVTIPEDTVKALGWEKGQELEATVRGKELRIHQKDER